MALSVNDGSARIGIAVPAGTICTVSKYLEPDPVAANAMPPEPVTVYALVNEASRFVPLLSNNFPTMASLVPQSTSRRYHEFAFQIEDDVRVEPRTIVELALSSMSSWLVAGETTNESVRAELDAKPKYAGAAGTSLELEPDRERLARLNLDRRVVAIDPVTPAARDQAVSAIVLGRRRDREGRGSGAEEGVRTEIAAFETPRSYRRAGERLS